MILFKSEHVEPILSGRKTQTRRMGKRRWRIGAIHECRTALFGEPFAKVRILGVRQEQLGDISDADVRREGYDSVADYIQVFKRIYGRWNPEKLVWVVSFVRVEVVDNAESSGSR